MSGWEELGKAIEFIDRHPDDWNPLLTVRQAREWVVAAKTVRAALSGSTERTYTQAEHDESERQLRDCHDRLGAALSGSTAPLDEAWREAEAALPEGNWGVRLEGTSGYGWRAEAWTAAPAGFSMALAETPEGEDYPDPASALRALAVRAAVSPDPAQGET